MDKTFEKLYLKRKRKRGKNYSVHFRLSFLSEIKIYFLTEREKISSIQNGKCKIRLSQTFFPFFLNISVKGLDTYGIMVSGFFFSYFFADLIFYSALPYWEVGKNEKITHIHKWRWSLESLKSSKTYFQFVRKVENCFLITFWEEYYKEYSHRERKKDI